MYWGSYGVRATKYKTRVDVASKGRRREGRESKRVEDKKHVDRPVKCTLARNERDQVRIPRELWRRLSNFRPPFLSALPPLASFFPIPASGASTHAQMQRLLAAVRLSLSHAFKPFSGLKRNLHKSENTCGIEEPNGSTSMDRFYPFIVP